MAAGTPLHSAVVRRYGEIDNCEALGGAWVIDTDTGQSNHGSIGIEVCKHSCAQDVPTRLASWTWYHPAKTGYERVYGLNSDGTIQFLGGAGELAFNTKTLTFTPEKDHG